MLLLDALYINNSGGKVLLDLLIQSLFNSGKEVFYLLDLRCSGQYDFLPSTNTLYLKASVKARTKFYKENGDRFSSVLCFGNIPPTRRLKAKVYTYFHNTILLEQPKTLSVKEKLKLKIKKFYIRLHKRNCDVWLVQTNYGKQLLSKKLSLNESNIEIYPFYKEKAKIITNRPQDSFGYISSAPPHKNHLTLLKAWEHLHAQGITPLLNLTVTENFRQVISIIEKLKSKGVRINNQGWVDSSEFYSQNRYLIYPSLTESFGLGLIEAVEAGCDVIGADLPYLYEVIQPHFVFNPNDHLSIATTVINALEYKGFPKAKCIVNNRLDDLIKQVTKEK